MIIIGKLHYKEENGFARVESIIKTYGKPDFLIYVEVEQAYGKYLVTDRADAFLAGLFIKAMTAGEDITCEDPVSSDLKFKLEKLLIRTLAKHDERFHETQIYADIIDEPIPNAGAVGTGISLGLDSFDTIADTYDSKYPGMKLTHLVTFNGGVFGGYYQKNNWDYCAAKLYKRIQLVAEELKLPLIPISTNIHKYVRLKGNFYSTCMILLFIMSLGKLFKTYFISSDGVDFSLFNVQSTYLDDMTVYDLLTLYCCSIPTGVQFISGGGEKDRLEKLKTISKFPIAVRNLQSCLTEHYNCMYCLKCKRNLLALDALNLLDKFKDSYDIGYYYIHRNEYLRYLCQQIQNHKLEAGLLMPAYQIIKQREPAVIDQIEQDLGRTAKQSLEIQRQRDIYKEYSRLFRNVLAIPNYIDKLKEWFSLNNIKTIIIYGPGGNESTQCLAALCKQIEVKIDYIVEDVKKGTKVSIPRLPESTIDYPPCDAVIICNMDKPQVIKRKLSEFLTIPIYEVKDVLTMTIKYSKKTNN
jgi:hypothetical protein